MASLLKNEEKKKKQPMVCTLDLTRIQGPGNFPCPHCGVIISPEDETENVYCILETKIKDQTLGELVIQCNKCTNQIRLVGFTILHAHCATF